MDNSPHTYVFNKNNGVPIIPFYDNYEDRELLKLTQFLKGIAKKIGKKEDVRQIICNSFKHDKITENLKNFEYMKNEVLMKENN